MSNPNKATVARHTLTMTDADGCEQTLIFTPLKNGRVQMYASEMGECWFYTVEQARDHYRDAVSRGWKAA